MTAGTAPAKKPREHPWRRAWRIADEHGLHIAAVTERGKRAYVLYRKNPHGPGIRIGRRSSYCALLSLVKFAAGIAGERHKPVDTATPAETAF